MPLHSVFSAQVVDLVWRALADPVQSLPEDDPERLKLARDRCSKSVLHQSDQILRRLVQKHMSELQG